ncbi:MAG: hypothetical protein HOC71_12535 [Candidatus Latescibacteria bacterium]|jgi:hypothetical protein|nr:hypothetical protein [Candidatus Latescibacterota bacterium]
MLFLKSNHTETNPKTYTEPSFSYINRCGRQEFFRIRDVLEDWFSRYPKIEKDEFLSRFQSENNTSFTSSFFELYLHELLLRLKYSVHIHPKISESKLKKPDFLAIAPDGKELFIEAVITTEAKKESSSANAIKKVVYDKINTLNDPNFYVKLNEKSFPLTAPSGKNIKNCIKKWLQSLDPDQCLKLVIQKNFDDLPKLNFKHDNWEIEFTAYPRSIKARGKPGRRLISAHTPCFQKIDSSTPLRKAILRKATHYGDLGKPYFIAVNMLGNFIDDIDIMDALFGKETIVFNHPFDLGKEHEITREPNGAWTSVFGPRYSRVSGVLIGLNILPWNIAKNDLALYINPWSKYPYECPIMDLTKYTPINNKLEKKEGVHPRLIFELSEDWPSENSYN